MCSCNACMEYSKFIRNMDLVPHEVRPYFENLYEKMVVAQHDSDYYKAIVKGTWPNSDDIIASHRPDAMPEATRVGAIAQLFASLESLSATQVMLCSIPNQRDASAIQEVLEAYEVVKSIT